MERARTPAARLSVDHDLVFRLLRLVNLIAKPFFSEHASRYHLSINDWRVMAALAAGGKLAASDICQQTGMHPMNVSRSVAHLARLGRVRRGVDPRDRRRNLLCLTPAGTCCSTMRWTMACIVCGGNSVKIGISRRRAMAAFWSPRLKRERTLWPRLRRNPGWRLLMVWKSSVESAHRMVSSAATALLVCTDSVWCCDQSSQGH